MRVKTVKGNDGPAAGAVGVEVGVVVPVAFQELGVYDGAGLAAPQDQTKGGMSHEARPVQGPVQEGAALQSVPGIDPVAAISPQTGCKKTETGNRPADLPKRASGCGARATRPNCSGFRPCFCVFDPLSSDIAKTWILSFVLFPYPCPKIKNSQGPVLSIPHLWDPAK